MLSDNGGPLSLRLLRRRSTSPPIHTCHGRNQPRWDAVVAKEVAMTKPTWGDVVRIVPSAPAEDRPGELASVCGLWETEGGLLVLVEYSDGESREIPEQMLELSKVDQGEGKDSDRP